MREIDSDTIHRHARRADVDIDVTGIDLVKLLQEAYNLSRPQGAGYLRYRPGPLTDEKAREFVDVAREANPAFALKVDYLHGRSLKLLVKRAGDRWTMRSTWLDHTDLELVELLYRCGFNPWHF